MSNSSNIKSLAVDWAMEETGLSPETVPSQCPFTPEQVLNDQFLPGD